MNKDDITINLEQIDSSIKVLTEINNMTKDDVLLTPFYEIKKYIDKINFEHGNCIDYNKEYNFIKSNVELLKKELIQLKKAMEETSELYININSESKNTDTEFRFNKLSSNNNKMIAEKLNYTPSDNFSYIETNTNNQNEINPVPIALSVVAGAIAGVAGMVAMDNMINKKSDKKDKVQKDSNDEEVIVEDEYPKKEEVVVEPYMASRAIREADKYYGNLDEDDNDM